MNSGLIGKIEKAHRYAKEPERIQVQSLQARFNGDNDSYDVSLSDGEWRCRCHTYDTFGDCQHVMAIQILLHDMLSEQAQGSAAVVSAR
ncbi:MAG: hypothetical protein WKH64_11150 [Chloroflexia bacterium]